MHEYIFKVNGHRQVVRSKLSRESTLAFMIALNIGRKVQLVNPTYNTLDTLALPT